MNRLLEARQILRDVVEVRSKVLVSLEKCRVDKAESEVLGLDHIAAGFQDCIEMEQATLRDLDSTLASVNLILAEYN